MNERWRIEAEITFDVKEGENEQQALDRVKSALNGMLVKEREINHYHILKLPHTCYEFD